MENKGVIYILTNPSFPKYVKIGYANNIEKRLSSLNRSECIPFAFRLYAYYEVNERLSDLKIHSMIDKLNPELRSIDTFNGKPRKKEFYAISKETAYNILDSIASVSGTNERLHFYEEEIASTNETEVEEIDNIDYDIDTFLSNKNPEVIKVYELIFKDMKARLPEVYQKATPNYIALRNENGSNICEFHLNKSRVLVQTRVPLNTKLQIGEKVPDNYLWALNYRINVYKKDEIQKVVEALLDVYNQLKK